TVAFSSATIDSAGSHAPLDRSVSIRLVLGGTCAGWFGRANAAVVTSAMAGTSAGVSSLINTAGTIGGRQRVEQPKYQRAGELPSSTALPASLNHRGEGRVRWPEPGDVAEPAGVGIR